MLQQAGSAAGSRQPPNYAEQACRIGVRRIEQLCGLLRLSDSCERDLNSSDNAGRRETLRIPETENAKLLILRRHDGNSSGDWPMTRVESEDEQAKCAGAG